MVLVLFFYLLIFFNCNPKLILFLSVSKSLKTQAMSETKNLPVTKDETEFLNSCLNALKIIMLNGTPENEDIEKQAKDNGLTLQAIQSKLPKF